MNIILAKSAGFCFGVKRAVETVYKEAEKNQTPIYTFGPIIHNEEVVADLEKKGVQVIHSTDELKGRPKGTVIIRSHGVERKIYDEIKALGFEIVDATWSVCVEDPPSCGTVQQRRISYYYYWK